MVSKANRWDERAKVERLFTALEGPPESFFCHYIQEHPLVNWEMIKAEIIRTFPNTSDNFNSIASILNRKQGENESFDSYWFSKLELIDIKRPNLRNRDKIDLLIDGLKPTLKSKVMYKLVGRQVENLDEMREIVRETNDLVKFKTPLTDQKKKPRNERSFFAEDTRTPRSNYFRRYPYNRIEKPQHDKDNSMDMQTLQKSINDLKSLVMQKPKITERNLRRNVDREGNTTPKQVDLNYKPARKIRCYTCQKEGHMSSNCPDRPNREKAFPKNENRQN